jgi:hypothetical protein
MANPLPFPMPFQEQTYWCWSAVSKGTIDFYTQGNNPFTQCSIATSLLHQDCCNGAAAQCNVTQELQDALSAVGRFSGNIEYYSSVGPFDQAKQTISTEIGGGRPLGAQITWRDGTKHFVTVCGYDFSDPDRCVLSVLNPECDSIPCPGAPPMDSVGLEEFFSNYKGQGGCTALYLTI